MDVNSTGNVRILKGIVIGLGVLILLAFAGLVYGIIHKVGQQRAAETAAPGAPLAVLPPPPANWTSHVGLPSGARVDSVTAAEGRLILTLKQADGGSEIRLFDLMTGQPAGALSLAP